nr:MAG: hypothetical protein [Bacteriophage sp.]
MTEQNTNQTETQTTQQPTQQPIIINNVMAPQDNDKGKKKAPGFLKVCVYSVFTGGLYFFYWLVKMLSGGYSKR